MSLRKRERTRDPRPVGLPKGAAIVHVGNVYDMNGRAGEITMIGGSASVGDPNAQAVRVRCGDCHWYADVHVTRAPDGTIYVLNTNAPAHRLTMHRRGEECDGRQRRNRLTRDGWAKVQSLVLRDALIHARRLAREHNERPGAVVEQLLTAPGVLMDPSLESRRNYMLTPEVWASKREVELFEELVRRYTTLEPRKVGEFFLFVENAPTGARAACELAWPSEGGLVRLFHCEPEMRHAEIARALAAFGSAVGAKGGAL